ncbi:MAG: MerR family transcriptional regulator, partial [Burkholderiales bacterium]|nr:MerR family transcriptional regulator [Burkholderiales bacterium]
MKKPRQAMTPAERPPAAPGHRSGAVARMLGMPVATLRVWERRYGLTQAALSPGGQRLYSAADVQRLALLRQLADRGHAIGRLAPLGLAQLRRVAATHADAQSVALAGRPRPETPTHAAHAARPWRLALVGA